MTSAVLTVEPALIAGSGHRPVAVIARVEGMRVLRSPAVPILCCYLLLGFGLDGIVSKEGWGSVDRAEIADLIAYLCLLVLGPMTFVATHLVATSTRRSGAERLIAAVPVDKRRRDLGLCLGVLAGPATAALALTAFAAWLATDINPDPARQLDVEPWSITDIAQIPAIVLGAGILAIVLARWIPLPGSMLVGFVGLLFFTGWMVADGSSVAQHWLAPYVVTQWWFDSEWTVGGSPSWHLVYLLGLSALGVCAVALRQPERRRPWLSASAAVAVLVITAGILQLP